jgi:hypothetical protein
MVAVGTDSAVYLIDADTDQYKWFQNLNARVRDVFPLQAPSGPAVGVAVLDGYYTDISDLLVLDIAHGMQKNDFVLNMSGQPLLLGLSVINLTQSPKDPTHIFAIKTTDYGAADVAVPFDNNPVAPMPYYNKGAPQGGFTTMSAMKSGDGTIRVVWAESSAPDNNSDAVYYSNDTGSGPSPNGPLRCDVSQCASPLRLEDAVADPTASDSVFAICDGAGTITHVVRLSSSGSCQLIFDGSKLPSLVFPVRLALRLS